MTTPLLKSSVREDPSSWCLLGFIPDLKKTSSAKKKQEAQCKREKGRNQHIYHKCLRQYWSQFSARWCRDLPRTFAWAISFATWK
jgi:hypothetical protein